ncbi:hypothetical protein WICMUC_003093 [Wickerhamomyces mucosus]|uniref:Uncharacterized protein n=1 Tax=Wickerhamomyces mucosus TaxID=1378264 RepID=A0A9P8PMM7_9ASCO|nr:hypothetical protein WICMUC_003093 [Wickerhamomyces mucosus]
MSSTTNGAIRNQLLSGGIGNIDVQMETPINSQGHPQQRQPHPQLHHQQYSSQQLPPQQHQHQLHPQQYQQFPPQQYAPQQYPPQQYAPQQYPPQNYTGQPHDPQQYVSQQYYPPQPRSHQKPSSRRSSLTSNNPSFFGKMTKKKKSHSGGGDGDDDDDDDGKDVHLESSQANGMSFDELSTIKDRGRYGGGSNFDTTPIIPTLSTLNKPISQLSNNQYRKQMNNIKKKAMNSFTNDPRSMSLQTGSNPYLQQQQQQQQQHQQQLQGSRGNSLAGRSPYQPVPFPNQPQGPPQPGMMSNGPRAMSLQTGNPYQQQRIPQQRPLLQQRPFPSQQGFQPISAPQQPGLNTRKRLSVPNVNPPYKNNHGNLSQGSLPTQYSRQAHSQQTVQLKPSGLPQNNALPENSSQPTQKPLEPIQNQQNKQLVEGSHSSFNSNDSVVDRVSLTDDLELDEKPLAESSHHYLAENTLTDSFNNDSTLDESLNHSTIDEKEEIEQDSPSKLPRSKALPHLSLLSLNDGDNDQDEQDSTDDEIAQVPVENYKTLNPIYEPKNLNDGQQQLYQRQSPSKRMSQSPAKSQKRATNNFSISSMSDYSSFSGVSDHFASSQHQQQQQQKIYQLSNNTTNNDVFVTASQFSLVDQNNFKPQHELQKSEPESKFDPIEEIKDQKSQTMTYDNDKTPVLQPSIERNDTREKRTSINEDLNSIHSTKSNRSTSSFSFKSPKFIKNWKNKRNDKKKQNDHEKTIGSYEQNQDIVSSEWNTGFHSITPPSSAAKTEKPFNLEIKRDETGDTNIIPPSSFLESNGTSKNSDTTKSLEGFFVPKKSPSKKLGLTIEQLGIMEDTTNLINELELVSNELVDSIRREIQLEEKLKNQNLKIEFKSRDQSSELIKLVKSLNLQRQKRYIAEEHVLLFENGSNPSALELNYEVQNLKNELLIKDEIINKQNAGLKSLPEYITKINELTEENKTLVNEIIPSLKNQVQMLNKDSNNTSILNERIKILNNEKLEYQRILKELNYEASNNSYLNSSSHNDNPSPNKSFNSSPNRSNHSSPNKSVTSISGSKSNNSLNVPLTNFKRKNRLTSFSFINVSASDD